MSIPNLQTSKENEHEVWSKNCSLREMFERVRRNAHPAKMPFRPLREKLTDKPVLYGVLSLENRIYRNKKIEGDINTNRRNVHHDKSGE